MTRGLDVAIIGGGPVGLTLANLLARRGVSLKVFERQPQPYPLPRAIHFDGEVMRGFQAAGLAEAILPHTHLGKGMLFQTAAGETLIDWSRAQQIGPMGWHESYRFYQPGVEAAMRAGLGAYKHAELLTGAEVSRVEAGPEDGTLTLADGARHAAKIIVACDGAGSATRQALGIDLLDLGFQERWLVVDVKLRRPRADLGDYSIQICDPKAPATYVRGAGDWRRWEMRLREGEGEGEGEGDPAPTPMPEAVIWRRLSRWITPEDATLERGAIYTFRSRIAKRWRAGRVLLAGDAVHQMPPFMGQGMCAGIRDAANLWWKILAVLNGYDAALLDSYQSEREANARAFIEKSVALGRLINQTAQGHVPQGKMASIWPDLGPGLGPRDGIGGRLMPQGMAGGQRADDAHQHRCYLSGEAILRPDGYALGPASPEVTALAEALNARLAPRPGLG